MGWRWTWFLAILWNIGVHIAYFQWSSVQDDLDDLRDWWNSFWGAITDYADDIKSWAQSKISYLSGYAYGLYVQALSLLYDVRDAVVSWVEGEFSNLWSTFWGKVNDLYNYAYSLYQSAIDWARNKANAVYDALYNWASWLFNWTIGHFNWITGFYDLIANFLQGARSAIDWLWHQAWGALQSFLSNPVGFVLGWLLTPITNIVNWWATHGPLLMDWVANDLHEWMTLWRNGKRIIKALVNNPEQFILDYLAPKFIDWVAQLIADNW